MEPSEIKQRLDALGLSVNSFAARIQITPHQVRRCLNGSQRMPPPTCELLKAWQQAMDHGIPYRS